MPWKPNSTCRPTSNIFLLLALSSKYNYLWPGLNVWIYPWNQPLFCMMCPYLHLLLAFNYAILPFIKLAQGFKSRQMSESTRPLHRSSISHSCMVRPAPCGSLQSHSPGVFSQCSPWAWLCWMRLNRPSAPSHLQGSLWSKCCLMSHWPSPPFWVSVQGLPLGQEPPQRPFIPLSRHKIRIPDQD